ncbi:hypothetical protein CBR_g41814 [Chara braunii]|uniref:Protein DETOXIFICATION n=1 Tax=Chara braunii TaxID=69332 RepID=A0A388LWP8_CHABU|nr:hypothetical protein CBR_g41814 [Chara braunii]|eukprot:GBG86750.1 hypothetical protein CBR_g41814 [Chara braunii]
MLSDFMAERRLEDSYRTTHPTESGYTWFSSQSIGAHPPPKRRLDLVLTVGAAWEALTTIESSIESISDHRPVVVSFELPDQLVRGPGTFRLNVELLKSPDIIQWVKEHWEGWHHTRADFGTEEDWLQMGFRVVTRALDVFSGIQARGRRHEEHKWRDIVANAEAELDKNPLTELYWTRILPPSSVVVLDQGFAAKGHESETRTELSFPITVGTFTAIHLAEPLRGKLSKLWRETNMGAPVKNGVVDDHHAIMSVPGDVVAPLKGVIVTRTNVGVKPTAGKHDVNSHGARILENCEFQQSPDLPRFLPTVWGHHMGQLRGANSSEILLEFKRCFALAGPTALANILWFSRVVISTIYLGHLGNNDLAGAALAMGFCNATGYSLVMGLATGIDPICAQAYGARKYKLLQLTMQRAIIMLQCVSAIIIVFLWLNVEKILILCGQDPEIAAWWTLEIITILAGLLPDPSTAVAAMSILLNCALMFAMTPTAVSQSASTRVGIELGANSPPAAHLAAYVAWSISFVLAGTSLTFFSTCGAHVARLFTNIAAVQLRIQKVIPLLGIVQLFSIPQSVAAGILRGCARPDALLGVSLVAFYFIGLPLAAYLAFVMHMGDAGLWCGLIAAEVVAALAIASIILLLDWGTEAKRAQLFVTKSQCSATIPHDDDLHVDRADTGKKDPTNDCRQKWAGTDYHNIADQSLTAPLLNDEEEDSTCENRKPAGNRLDIPLTTATRSGSGPIIIISLTIYSQFRF